MGNGTDGLVGGFVKRICINMDEICALGGLGRGYMMDGNLAGGKDGWMGGI